MSKFKNENQNKKQVISQSQHQTLLSFSVCLSYLYQLSERCSAACEMRKRTVYVWVVAIVCFVVLMFVTPAIPQNQAYHDFADTREFFGTILFFLGFLILHQFPLLLFYLFV